MLISIDFDNISDELVYQAFGVDGNEVDALNDSYLELFELIGRDAMLKLFKHFRGDKIDCPMLLYRPEFIVDRERAKIARAVYRRIFSQGNREYVEQTQERKRG